jgi:hypothetical protein
VKTPGLDAGELPREVSAIYFTLTTTLPFARPVST